MTQPRLLARNDPRQYDDLASHWWDRHGPFASLHWIAKARGQLVPPAQAPRSLLIDVGCGAGLLAPHIAGKGYRHIGVDLNSEALRQSVQHGVCPVRADAADLPFDDAVADVVCAGELLEHVADPDAVVRECCRVLKPGGLLVIDTIANTSLARFMAITIAERVPGAAPRGIHDSAFFVDRARLVRAAAAEGVPLTLRGLRPSVLSLLAFLPRNRRTGHMVPTASTAVLFQGWGTKAV